MAALVVASASDEVVRRDLSDADAKWRVSGFPAPLGRRWVARGANPWTAGRRGWSSP